MDPTVWLLLAIFAPVACGLATLTLPRHVLGGRVALALAGPIVTVVMLGAFIARYGTMGEAVAGSGIIWIPLVQLNLQLNADKLGLFFALLVSVFGILITVYARAYFGPDRDSLFRFYPYLHLFMTAMLGVALADNFMFLLLFWEMTSISSFLLIGWEHDDPKSVKLAMQAFIVTTLGGLVMMGGLILLGVTSGQWTFSGLVMAVNAGRVPFDASMAASFVMIFVGAAAKSAQIPFHFWLPGAMAAPTPVSAYLHSATMVKAGVYLTGRMWPIFAVVLPSIWSNLIVPIGALTMVYGAFVALQKHDLKKIFAYTTVSQLGLLMTMYGLGAFEYYGQRNLLWDVTQILNHAMYKAPLFILAGAIGHVASRQLPQLKGFFWRDRTSKIMTVVLLLAGYGLAAGPFTVSFSAKEIFFYQIYHAREHMASPLFWALVTAAVGTGMFNVAIFLRLCTTLFGRPQPNAYDAHAHHGPGGHGRETGIWPVFLWIPGLVIVAFQYIGGIIPGAYEMLFGWLEPNMHNYHFQTSVGAFPMIWDIHELNLPLKMSLCAIGLGFVLGLVPILRRQYNDPFDHVYPGFYTLCTRGGGRVFRIVQTGNAGTYVAVVFVAMVGLFAWSAGFNLLEWSAWQDRWPAQAAFESSQDPQLRSELRTGALLAVMVCLTAVLLPVVKDRASRVLVLGACGFSVAAVYYVFKAPDLALTQVSIEIVSLMLFLLVLSMLPNPKPGRVLWIGPRLVLSIAVGLVMFWLTLTSAVGQRVTMPYVTGEGKAYANLGEFFKRNSYHAADTVAVPASQVYGGVVDRGEAHRTSFGTKSHGHKGRHGQATVTVHKGGGGRNLVNVILVDFRGFDTIGEITVLALAALGVWTLLRRSRRTALGADDNGDDVYPHAEGLTNGAIDYSRVDIGEPTGGSDPQNQPLSRIAQRSPVT